MLIPLLILLMMKHTIIVHLNYNLPKSLRLEMYQIKRLSEIAAALNNCLQEAHLKATTEVSQWLQKSHHMKV